MNKMTIEQLTTIPPFEFIICQNAEFEEQKALYSVTHKKVLVIGDYVHDKINEQIKGALATLDFLGVPYQTWNITVFRGSPFFTELGFIENE